jgi:hypothetical protein
MPKPSSSSAQKLAVQDCPDAADSGCSDCNSEIPRRTRGRGGSSVSDRADGHRLYATSPSVEIPAGSSPSLDEAQIESDCKQHALIFYVRMARAGRQVTSPSEEAPLQDVVDSARAAEGLSCEGEHSIESDDDVFQFEV